MRPLIFFFFSGVWQFCIILSPYFHLFLSLSYCNTGPSTSQNHQWLQCLQSQVETPCRPYKTFWLHLWPYWFHTDHILIPVCISPQTSRFLSLFESVAFSAWDIFVILPHRIYGENSLQTPALLPPAGTLASPPAAGGLSLAFLLSTIPRSHRTLTTAWEFEVYGYLWVPWGLGFFSGPFLAPNPIMRIWRRKGSWGRKGGRIPEGDLTTFIPLLQ